MSTVKTKTISFEKLLPDFKRFVQKKNALSPKPILRNVYFDGEHLVSTDSHTLLRVNKDYIDSFNESEPFLYDPSKKEVVESDTKYPTVSRLIPDNHNTTITVDSKLLKDMRSSLNDLWEGVKEKRNHIIDIEVFDGQLTLSNNDKSSTHVCNIEGNEGKLSVNCKYLKNALMTVNKLVKLSNEEVTINTISPMRPIHIKQEDVFDIIVMPVRKY